MAKRVVNNPEAGDWSLPEIQEKKIEQQQKPPLSRKDHGDSLDEQGVEQSPKTKKMLKDFNKNWEQKKEFTGEGECGLDEKEINLEQEVKKCPLNTKNMLTNLDEQWGKTNGFVEENVEKQTNLEKVEEKTNESDQSFSWSKEMEPEKEVEENALKLNNMMTKFDEEWKVTVELANEVIAFDNKWADYSSNQYLEWCKLKIQWKEYLTLLDKEIEKNIQFKKRCDKEIEEEKAEVERMDRIIKEYKTQALEEAWVGPGENNEKIKVVSTLDSYKDMEDLIRDSNEAEAGSTLTLHGNTKDKGEEDAVWNEERSFAGSSYYSCYSLHGSTKDKDKEDAVWNEERSFAGSSYYSCDE